MRRRLLVADANRATAGLFDAYFSKVGYQVDTVTDGLSCVHRLRRTFPDLLLLDRELPWGGGDGVLACLRAEYSLSKVPVVVIADVIPISALSRLLIPPVIGCFPKQSPVTSIRYCIDSALALRS